MDNAVLGAWVALRRRVRALLECPWHAVRNGKKATYKAQEENS